jgi:predicted nuclease with TOPRIM domain
MEQAILEAENRVAELEAIFQTPDFYARHGHEAARLKEDLEKSRKECERLYSRWEFLENKKNS